MNIESYTPKDLYDFYDNAIEINKFVRSFFDFNKTALSVYQYMNEFGTVRINLGRRTCKTTYIMGKEDNKNDIILIRHDNNQYNKKNRYVFTVNDRIEKMRGILKENSTIWVDDYSGFYENDKTIIDELLYGLYTSPDQTIVLLG